MFNNYIAIEIVNLIQLSLSHLLLESYSIISRPCKISNREESRESFFSRWRELFFGDDERGAGMRKEERGRRQSKKYKRQWWCKRVFSRGARPVFLYKRFRYGVNNRDYYSLGIVIKGTFCSVGYRWPRNEIGLRGLLKNINPFVQFFFPFLSFRKFGTEKLTSNF